MKKLIAILLTLAVLCSMALVVTAAGVTIDTAATASLSLYKYDLTAATGAGVVTDSFVSTGEKNSAAEAALAPYAIQGVKFTCLKIADISNQTTQPNNTDASVSLLYGMPSGDTTTNLLAAIGLSYDNAYTSNDTTYYYTADVLQSALNAALTNSTTTKNTLEGYIKANGGTVMPETDANGYSTVAGLPLGLYLVVESYVPEQVTSTVNPFFVSLPMTTIAGTEWNYDVTVYPKNETGKPTLEKTVREAAEDTGKNNGSATDITDGYAHTGTGSEGDVFDYQVISKLPAITSDATALTTYTFVDTLSKGLTYNKSDVKLEWFTDTACTDLITTWTEADGKFSVDYAEAADSAEQMTIAMTANGLAEINSGNALFDASSVYRGYSQCTLRITYAATLNSNAEAVLGDEGNPNDVTLTWKRTNTTYYDTLSDDCHIYSYGVELVKEFHDAGGKVENGNFENVKFALRNDTDDYFVKAVLTDGIYYVEDHVAEDEATIFVPDADGKIVVRGLEDDTYYIRETATDSGYQLLADEVKIEIVTAESETRCDLCGKALLTATAKVNDKDVTMLEDGASVNAVAPLTIVNNHDFDFPRTGSTGTWTLTICGILGMAVCAALLVIVIARGKKAKVKG